MRVVIILLSISSLFLAHKYVKVKCEKILHEHNMKHVRKMLDEHTSLCAEYKAALKDFGNTNDKLVIDMIVSLEHLTQRCMSAIQLSLKE